MRKCSDLRSQLSPDRRDHIINTHRNIAGWANQPPVGYTTKSDAQFAAVVSNDYFAGKVFAVELPAPKSMLQRWRAS